MRNMRKPTFFAATSEVRIHVCSWHCKKPRWRQSRVEGGVGPARQIVQRLFKPLAASSIQAFPARLLASLINRAKIPFSQPGAKV
jgi:hypothetical protein